MWSANKDRFHVIPIDKPSDKPIEVIVSQLKAVLVVQDFNGDPQYVERKRFLEGETPYGTPLEVTFGDGQNQAHSETLSQPRYFSNPDT